MSRRPIPLAERLRHGLASALLSAAALAAPAAEATSPQNPRLAQSQGRASQPATRGQASKTPRATAPKPSPSAKAKPPGGQAAAPAPAGCGAHDGGCGPSR